MLHAPATARRVPNVLESEDNHSSTHKKKCGGVTLGNFDDLYSDILYIDHIGGA